MLKILMINYEFPPLGGGGGVITSHIATELAKRHEVEVLTSSSKGLSNFEVVEGIKVYRVPVLGRSKQSTATLASLLSFPLSSLFKGIKLCRGKRYDVVNTHFVVPTGPTGVVLSRLFRIPNVLSVHGGDIYDPSKALSPHKNYLLRKIVEYVLNHSTCVLAESNDVKRRAISHYRVKKEITVIPWGLKEPTFVKASRVEFGMSQDEFLIIAVGRLVKRKGLDCLLQAVAKIQIPTVKVVLIGDGPERNHLESLAVALGIRQQILFLGAVSEEKKFQYLSVSDVFTLPSLHEGFGIVFLEAMYCGLPIITTDNGGQADFLKDRRNGFLVPVGDAEAMADKILILVQNHDLRMWMSVNNREDVKRFSVSATAERYERVFEQIANAKGENE
jgi:glycosyltransferase involved in cell wall biosynthesis